MQNKVQDPMQFMYQYASMD